MNEDKTSIIVTSHNYAEYLGECVDSLISQTIKPKEIIVVDDASSDNASDIMKKYSDNPIVQFYAVDFKNAQNSRNFGLSKVTGEYLMFLDADDYLRNDFLEKTQYVLHNKPEIDLVYSDRENFGPPGALEKIGQKKNWKTSNYSYEELKKHNYISLPALIRREKFSGFDEKINRFQDWDAWLTYLKGKYAYHISEPLFYVRFHGKNKTFASNKYNEKLKVQMKHGLISHKKLKNGNEYFTEKKKNIMIIAGKRDDYAPLMRYIEKIKENNNEIYLYFSRFDLHINLPREIARKLISLKIKYRIARGHNSDEVCNFAREGALVSPYNLDFIVILGADTHRDIAKIFPFKFNADLAWDSEKESFLDMKFLDEGNWIFNKGGIKKFFNL